MKPRKFILSFIIMILILSIPVTAKGQIADNAQNLLIAENSESLAVSNVGLSADKFEPVNGPLKISFTTNTEAYMYCDVYDANNNKIAVVSKGGSVPKAGNWTVSWKGTNSAGNVVAAGSYTVVFYCSDIDGISSEPVYLNVQVLGSSVVPQISKLVLSTNRITPGTDKVKISFYANMASKVYCRVYDKNNQKVATVDNGSNLSKASTWSLTWDGSVSTGKYLAPGTYAIQVFLNTADGNSKVLSLNIEIASSVPNKTINFPDRTLELCVRYAIDKDLGDILLSDVQKLTKLDIYAQYEGYAAVKDLTGMEYLTNLNYLKISQQNVSNIEPLKNLKKLKSLYLDFNKISNINALSNLKSLNTLQVGGNKITSVEALRNLTNLQYLYIGTTFVGGENNVSDISPLRGLTNLKELSLWGNDNITDIEPLRGLINLTLLNIRGPHIPNLAALSGMRNLKNLDVGASNSKISDISVLQKLTNLEELDISYNKITKLDSLSGLTKLTSLSIAGNNIRYLTPISNCVNIRKLFIGTSCAGGNPITDFSVLYKLKKLDTLFLESMGLKKIDFLANLTNLTFLNLGYNQITNIEPLRNLNKLTSLYLNENKITDYSPLDGYRNNLENTDVTY